MGFLRQFGLYTLKRLLFLIPLLLAMTLFAFMVIRVGDVNPAALVAGPTATQEELERVSQDLGLDQPLIVQYASYMKRMLSGDFGTSWVTRRPVLTEVRVRLPITLELLAVSSFFAVVSGVAFGLASGMKEGALVDQSLRVLSLGGISMPTFWVGLLLIYVMFVLWDLAPPPLGRINILISPPERITGFPVVDGALQGDWPAVRSMISQMILPVAAIVLVMGATIMKQTRTAVIEIKGTAMVRYARACGLSRTHVSRIILRNAMPPVITVSALAFSAFLGGSALVEIIFGWGGLGQLGVTAIQRADFAVVQAYILAMGIVCSLVYLLADLVNAVLDPRISYR